MLYQRNMFPLAIELAQNFGVDAQQQSLIYRRFGDYLYQKADYDGAMVQYIRAMDATEPSQVIRKVCACTHFRAIVIADLDSSLILNEYTTSSSTWNSCMSVGRPLPTTQRCF